MACVISQKKCILTQHNCDITMENKENLTTITSEELKRLKQIELQNENKRKAHKLAVQKWRGKKKQQKKEALEKESKLRSIPRMTYVDDLIGNDIERIGKMNMGDRIVEVGEKFRITKSYDCTNNAGPFIIQYKHNEHCWIDWLEVKKPSSDPYGYGLFALQDIRPWKFVSLYLGNQYNSIEDHDNARDDNIYTLLSHVAHNGKKWIMNRKKTVYVVPEIKGKKWVGNVDKVYLGGHLINTFDRVNKKSANVAFDYYFGVYSLKPIKRGDELLVLYNREEPKKPKFRTKKN